MNHSFRLGPDGIYRCDGLQQFVWQKHGFGTRLGNPPIDISLRQVHSDRVVNAAVSKDREREGDALITQETGKCIGVRTADCVPILLVDAKNRAVAAVHAGWRGTASGIVKNAIHTMHEDFSTNAEDVYAALGPSIGGCCYEVGPEVADRFAEFFPGWQESSSKRKLNLAEANRRQLEGAGVRSERIFDCCLCTTCDPAQFFSFRREPENPGRMIASICRLA